GDRPGMDRRPDRGRGVPGDRGRARTHRQEEHSAGDAAHARADQRKREGGRGMDQDTSTLRADIERERRELGETVAALAEKADVKSQAQRKIAETKENIDRKRS